MATFFSPTRPCTMVYCNLPTGRVKIKFSEHYYNTNDPNLIKYLRGRIHDGEKDYTELISKYRSNGKHKYLLQRQGGIGDILFITPLMKYLKKQGHYVSFYMHFGYFEVLQKNPYIDKIYVNRELSNIAKLPAGFGDALFDMEAYNYNQVFPEYMTKKSYVKYDRPIIFNGVIEQNPLAEKDHAVDVCYRYAGIDPEGKPKDLVLNITEAERAWAKNDLKSRGYNMKKKFIGIAPNASYALNRSWRKDYVEILKERLQKYFNVVYLHRGQGWNLREAMRIISQMDLMITSDTGLLHVAGALEIPLIALFGPFNPDFRCRYFKNCQVICPTEKICGKFCFNHADRCEKFNIERGYVPCMDIKPDEVFNKVKEML